MMKMCFRAPARRRKKVAPSATLPGRRASMGMSPRGLQAADHASHALRIEIREWAAENEDHLKAYRKKAYAENRDEILSNWSEWYAENHERELEKKRTRYADNREAALEYAREYRTANSAKVRAATAKWRSENPDKVKKSWADWYAENGKFRDAQKRATPRGKLDDLMSSAIYQAVLKRKAGRSWSDLVGYSVDDLMVHLERQFQPGMTWENHGQYGWHIDHIIPRSAFNYEKPEDIDFKRCWALENLQPVWWQDNLSKGAKLTKPFQPSLALAVNDNQHYKHEEMTHGATRRSI